MALPNLTYQQIRRKPDEMIRHLNEFALELKFSAGIWFFSPAGSRFHDKYRADLDIERRLEIAARLVPDGLSGLEAHYPTEINEANLDLWKKYCADSGLRIISVVPQLFYDARFEFGALSSPLEAVRHAAVQRTIECLRLNEELDTDFTIVWSGIDGYENPFGMDLIAARDRFAESLAEAMDMVPGIRLAFEPKPYEPRGRHFYGTTPEGLLLAMKVESLLRNDRNRELLRQGQALVALNPEIGHMLMAYEDLPYAFSQIMEYGRLAHCHVNSQPLGNYDQDLNVGVVAPEQLEAALYVLKMHGYRGYFGIDINPERMNPAPAIVNSMDAIRAANDRVNHLDHERVVWAVNHPDKARGWLESYLIRMRALHPQRLSPLPPLPRS
ncbi:MAG: TIM barrel protein [Myxococcales bacterium]|nr:TIM barrel protein [Myxococcales bacterium]